MANRVTVPVTNFETLSPPWSLASLDSDLLALQGALNDASLGYVTSGTDTGTANAYVIATPSFGTPSAYQVGMTVAFIPANTNTGNSTLTVGALGTQPILIAGAQVPPGALVAGNPVLVTYMGTAFQLISSPLGTSTNRFNAIGNPNFEVDQKNIGGPVTPVSGVGGSTVDRYGYFLTGATGRCTISQFNTMVLVPGTNFTISRVCLRVTLTASQASLATTDRLDISQTIEGPCIRELYSDVTSLSLLVRTSVAGLKFGITLRDGGAAYTLAKLCTIPNANAWTLIPLPNLPIFTASGTFNTGPGLVGSYLSIGLAEGATYTPPSNDTWISGNYLGANGQSNFFNNPVNSTFDIAFVQWEPGPLCTSLIDKPFDQNYRECLRYFQKSYDYGTAVGTAGTIGYLSLPVLIAGAVQYVAIPFVAPLAKPYVSGGIYNQATGALGTINNNVGTTFTLTAATASSRAISSITASTSFPVSYLLAQYAVDTGW